MNIYIYWYIVFDIHNRKYMYFSDIDNYEHICVSDREELLSQIYELLRLEQADDEDPTRISSPTDREKLRLAKQIAHDHTFKRSQSSPVCFIPSQHSSSSSSSQSSNTSSPTPKQRKQSAPTDGPSVLSSLKPKIAPATSKGSEPRFVYHMIIIGKFDCSI